MIIRNIYKIEGPLYDEALAYAENSKRYTSNRHDFHEGGLDNKKRKMLEGKLGEKAVKIILSRQLNSKHKEIYESQTKMV